MHARGPDRRSNGRDPTSRRRQLRPRNSHRGRADGPRPSRSAGLRGPACVRCRNLAGLGGLQEPRVASERVGRAKAVEGPRQATREDESLRKPCCDDSCRNSPVAVSKMPSCAVLPSPRTRYFRVVRQCWLAIRHKSSSPVSCAAWKMIPTFIMMSMKQLSWERKELRYCPFSLKRWLSVRPASTTTCLAAGLPVRSCQRL